MQGCKMNESDLAFVFIAAALLKGSGHGNVWKGKPYEKAFLLTTTNVLSAWAWREKKNTFLHFKKPHNLWQVKIHEMLFLFSCLRAFGRFWHFAAKKIYTHPRRDERNHLALSWHHEAQIKLIYRGQDKSLGEPYIHTEAECYTHAAKGFMIRQSREWT